MIQIVRRGDDGAAGGMNASTYHTPKTWFLKNDLLSESLTKVINRIGSGDVSAEGKIFLNSSRGVGIPKDEKGDLRPIAVGHILLRIIGSLALTKLSSDVQDFFTPVQFGVGIQNGCELMINAIKARLKLNPEDVCIKCDVKNAFNSFDRSVIWKTLRTHFPSIEAFVRLAYMETGTVTFIEPGDPAPTSIKSVVGSRQGCSLGSFLYALAIQPELLYFYAFEHVTQLF